MDWKEYLEYIPIIANVVKELKMLEKEDVVAIAGIAFSILFSIASHFYFFKLKEQEPSSPPRVVGVEGQYQDNANVEIGNVRVTDGNHTSGNGENGRVVGVRGKYIGQPKVKIGEVEVNTH